MCGSIENTCCKNVNAKSISGNIFIKNGEIARGKTTFSGNVTIENATTAHAASKKGDATVKNATYGSAQSKYGKATFNDFVGKYFLFK